MLIKAIMVLLVLSQLAFYPYDKGMELMIRNWNPLFQSEYIVDPNGVTIFFHYYYTWEDVIC